MRAEIDEKGKLRVYPDSETEQSALWAWCDGLKGGERSLIFSKLIAFSFDSGSVRVPRFSHSIPTEVLEKMTKTKASNSLAEACTELGNKRDAAVRAAFDMLFAAIKDDIRKL